MQKQGRKIKTAIGVLLLIICSCFVNHQVFFQGKAADTGIDTDVLSVRYQVATDATTDSNSTTRIRLISSLRASDLPQYSSVGFDVAFEGQGTEGSEGYEKPVTITDKSNTVYEIIESSFDNVKFNFGSKVIDTKSDYFVTCTISNIPQKYFDNGILVKPYVMKNGVKTYGESRYFKINDVISEKVMNIPVLGEIMNPSVTGYTTDGSYYDGTYTHIRIKQNAGELYSITNFTVTGGTENKTVQYRNLYSTKPKDTTWYDLGDKTDKEYVIVTKEELKGFQSLSTSNKFTGEKIYVAADIAVNEAWTPIGSGQVPFAGIFDGGKKTISGLTINATSKYVGMFSVSASGSTIKNFTLTDSSITNSEGYTGSIVGSGTGTIHNVKSSANVKGVSNVGGLVGANEASSLTITDCSYSGTMTTSSHNVGGLVGFSNQELKISDSMFNGTITSTAGYFNAGFVGCNNANLEITACDNKGTITAPDLWCGGYVGQSGATGTVTISNCKNAATLNLSGERGGGFIGNNAGVCNITDCEFTGTLTLREKNGGGFIGYSANTANITNSKFSGSVSSSQANVGGFIGNQEKGTASFVNSWSAGTITSTVSGNANLGGFVGTSGSDSVTPKTVFTSCLVSGEINASWHFVGGFIGLSYSEVEFSDSLITGIVTSANSIQVSSFETPFKGTVKITDTYALSTTNEKIFAYREDNVTGYPVVRSATELTGATAYEYTTLSQTYWKFTKDGYPELKSFSTKEEATIPNNVVRIDETWYGKGSATTFKLYNKEELFGFASLSQKTDFTGKTITLMNNIEVGTQYTWKPIGSARKQFNGIFDGGNKTISGLKVNATSDYAGMFAVAAASSEIKNFTLTNSSITNSGQYTGSIVGFGNGKLQNVKSSASVTSSNQMVGGLVGINSANSLTITNCEYSGTMTTSSHNVGGFVGRSEKELTISNSSFGGKLTSTAGYFNAGFVGFNGARLEITDCDNDGTITAPSLWCGGYVGHSANTGAVTISNCKNAATMNLSGERGGGYVGSSEGTCNITDSEFSGSLNLGASNGGGFIGYSVNTVTITSSKFSGILNSSSGAINGGFVGCNSGTLNISSSECSGTMTVSADYAGGFVGHAGQSAQIENSKYTGRMVLPTDKSYYGGFVGNGSAQIDISNCQYAGNMQNGQIIGGFIGAVGNGANIEHCLFASNGTMKESGNQNAGFVGMATGGTLTIDDSLFVGTVRHFSDWGALIVGRVGGATVNITNTFAKGTFGQKTAKHQSGTLTNSAVLITDAESLKGENAYIYAPLDYTNHWNVVAENYPELQVFPDNAAMTLPTNIIRADYSWYNDSAYTTNGNKYILTDASDLWGFTMVSQSDNFQGKTVELGANITVNTGTATEIAARATDSNATNDPITWIPVSAFGDGKEFAGTFDGQMYTISGLYRKSEIRGIALFVATAGTSTVKNLRITNSYFHYNGFEMQDDYVYPGYVASVAAWGNGNFENIYSSATIISEGNCAGGIIAAVNKYTSAEHSVKKCWFDGTVALRNHANATTQEQGSYFAGGIIGQVVNTSVKCTMTDCLNTGSVTGEINHLGGLCGYVADAGGLTIKSSLNVGSVTGNYQDKIHSIVGLVEGEIKSTMDQRSYLTLENVYSLKGVATSTGGHTVTNADTFGNDFLNWSNDSTGYITGAVTVLTSAKLQGDSAKTNASALFATSGVWKTVTGSTPILDFTWK